MTGTAKKSFEERYKGTLQKVRGGRVKLKPEAQATFVLCLCQMTQEYMRRYEAAETTSKDETIQYRARREREYCATAMQLLKLFAQRCDGTFDLEQLVDVEAFVTAGVPKVVLP